MKTLTIGNSTKHVPEINNNNMLNVLITDDHRFIRQSLKQILEEAPEIKLIHEAANGTELLNKIQAYDYHVILLDISMPGKSGLELLKEVKKIKPEVFVIMVSIHPDDQYVRCAIKFGASGYIAKTDAPDVLLCAINKVVNGEKYFSDRMPGYS